MAAALHCIVRDIEDSRLRDQLQIWRIKAKKDPLICHLRYLRQVEGYSRDKINKILTTVSVLCSTRCTAADRDEKEKAYYTLQEMGRSLRWA